MENSIGTYTQTDRLLEIILLEITHKRTDYYWKYLLELTHKQTDYWIACLFHRFWNKEIVVLQKSSWRKETFWICHLWLCLFQKHFWRKWTCIFWFSIRNHDKKKTFWNDTLQSGGLCCNRIYRPILEKIEKSKALAEDFSIFSSMTAEACKFYYSKFFLTCLFVCFSGRQGEAGWLLCNPLQEWVSRFSGIKPHVQEQYYRSSTLWILWVDIKDEKEAGLL